MTGHLAGYVVDVWIVAMLVWSVVVMWRDEQHRRDEVRRLPRIVVESRGTTPHWTRDPSPRARRRAS